MVKKIKYSQILNDLNFSLVREKEFTGERFKLVEQIKNKLENIFRRIIMNVVVV